MPDPVPDPATDDPDGAPRQLSAVPFAIALIGFVIIALLAFAFLRDDDDGRLVRPDRLTPVDDDTLRATAFAVPGCARVERAQVDITETEVLVELVTVDVEGQCSDVAVDVVAEIQLPVPIGERALRAGVGRTRLPCSGQGTSLTCGP